MAAIRCLEKLRRNWEGPRVRSRLYSRVPPLPREEERAHLGEDGRRRWRARPFQDGGRLWRAFAVDSRERDRSERKSSLSIFSTKGFTRACDTCQRVKYLNSRMEGPYEFVKAKSPNEFISVDFYGPLPTSAAEVHYIFVILYLFSKLITLYPIIRAKTNISLKTVKEKYFVEVGRPKRLLYDHETQFTSPGCKASLAAEGVKVLFSSIRHAQSNPVERFTRGELRPCIWYRCNPSRRAHTWLRRPQTILTDSWDTVTSAVAAVVFTWGRHRPYIWHRCTPSRPAHTWLRGTRTIRTPFRTADRGTPRSPY